MPILTIFTPTYNRAHTLPQLYDSLCRQTCMNFVWSIVDDGSSDNTGELVNQWSSECKVSISYVKQPNGGKMRAHNLGAKLCTTPLFCCIDSDDYAPDTLVDSIRKYYQQIKEDPTLAGIIAYKAIRQQDGSFKVIWHFPPLRTSTLNELSKKGYYGESAIVFKTDVLQKYPFLEVDGEKFSTENYAYCQIDLKYKYLLVDETWMLCTYMADGYTQAERSLFAKNPKGWALYYNLKVKCVPAYLNKEKLGYAILYMIFARRAGIKDIYALSELKTPLYPLFWILSYYYEWKWKEKYPK